jgi:hypothetical protein
MRAMITFWLVVNRCFCRDDAEALKEVHLQSCPAEVVARNGPPLELSPAAVARSFKCAQGGDAVSPGLADSGI